MKFLVINGPNLNMMHFTEPGVAGQLDYNGLLDYLELCCTQMGLEVEFFQSNHEGDLIDEIQSAAGRADGIILNPGGYAHYSVAILDALRLCGVPAVEVLLSEPVQTRREIGLQLGANAAIDPIHEDLTARIRALTGMDGVDVVIECVGNTIATAQAFSATKRGTTVLLFSVPKSGTTHPLSLEDVYQKELTIVGSIINPDTHQRAVDLINSGRIQLAPILTHRFPIERLKDAILMQMSSESLKVLVGSSYQ